MDQRKKYLTNAMWISAGGFFAKGLGAIYRIPLSNLLGGYGMGVYQIVYPLFCVMLTVSSAGVPSALSRIVAREESHGNVHSTVKTALKLFAVIGLCGTLLLCLLAPLMSVIQGNHALQVCYFALAPSVFLVSLIAVFRGYFQGKRDMRPTAYSEVLEQVVKVAVGLLLVLRHREEPLRAVQGALWAVTVSEFVTLLFLWRRYRGGRRREVPLARPIALLSATAPVMLSSALLPLSQTVDSIVIVRILSRYTNEAVSLYGLFTGGALALVNLPASLCYGLAVATVPLLSVEERQTRRSSALYALFLTFLLSFPCAVGLFLGAKPIASLLYPSLSEGENATLVTLIRLSASSAVCLPCVQTLSSCLTGLGRAKHAALGMGIAVFCKLVLQLILLPNPACSIEGAAIASSVCYLIAFFVDLFYTVREEKTAHAAQRLWHLSGDREKV